MHVIFLQNTLMNGRRYSAGDSAEVDADLGKSLVDAALAAESPTVKAAEEKPAAKRPARRSSVKAVKA